MDSLNADLASIVAVARTKPGPSCGSHEPLKPAVRTFVPRTSRMDGPDALSGASVAEPMLISKAGSASAGRAPAQAARHGALPFPGPLPFGAPFAMPMPGLPLPGMNGAPPRHAATLQEVLAGSRANGGTAAAGSGFGARPPQLPFAPFPAALSMPSATSMLKDINGHLSLQPPRPFPGLPSFSPLAALASAAQNQKQKQSPSDSKSPVSAGPQLPANGLLPGFPFKSVLPGQLPAYGAFSHLGPNPYLNHTSIPSLSAFTAMQNMAARPNTSKGPAQYGPVYPPGKPPLKRAPSASTIASSPGENGSSHTSPTASPIRAGPVVPSRAKEAKKRPAEEDLGDDDAVGTKQPLYLRIC